MSDTGTPGVQDAPRAEHAPTASAPAGPAIPARSTPAPAAAALLLAGLVYLVAELAAALAWSSPTYDWTHNLVTDLGSTGAGPNHQGLYVSSPRHALMNLGLVAQGLLFATAVVLLSRRVRGRTGTAMVALGVTQAVGLALLAAFATSPGASAADLVVNIGAGSVAIVASNVLVIVVGCRWRPLGLPPWVGWAGVVLGAAGLLASGALTVLGAPTGIAERVAIDSFVLWQVVAGASLLFTRVRDQPACPAPTEESAASVSSSPC